LAIVAVSSLTAMDLPINLPLSCSCSAASQTTCLWVSAAIAKDCYDMTCIELDQKMGAQTDVRARVIHTDPEKKKKKNETITQTNKYSNAYPSTLTKRDLLYKAHAT
jgi:hypothetical protein